MASWYKTKNWDTREPMWTERGNISKAVAGPGPISTRGRLADGKWDDMTSSVCRSQDAKEVVAFFKGNCLTMGFTIQVCVNPKTRQAVEIFKKGKVCQRDLKPLIALGFSEWHYSWGLQGDAIRTADGHILAIKTLDLATAADIAPWARAFGYA